MAVFRRTLILAAFAAFTIALVGCERTITLTEAVTGPLSCAQCHDGSNLITGKQTQWAESQHGTGTAYLRGTSASCAGCHSGNAFAERIEAGLAPNQVASGDPDPTRQDCRSCHKIHSTYTMADFALRSTAPVTFYADPAVTYDGGEGNLCVNCHQPRRIIPAAVGGVISGINTHWGPHHGPQSSMILGVGGAGVPDSPSPHYGVPNTCVSCHMGSGLDHHFEPSLSNCQSCHPGLNTFDRNRVQTEVDSLSNVLGGLLLSAGLIDMNSPDGEPTVTSAPEAQAQALWNWLYVTHEDKSRGVHNSNYTKAMLQTGIAAMTPAPLAVRTRND